jgi:hypothetical protein
MNYTNQVAQKFERGAVLIENFVAAGRAAGIAEIMLTAEQVRATQQQLASIGFNDDSLAVFAWLGVSQEFVDEHILPVALHADPNKAAGSYRAKLLELAAAYRWAGAALARKSRSISTVANPRDQTATVDLYVHRASIPPDWKLSLVNADDPSGDKSAPRPQEIEAGRHYRVTLPAKGQIKVASVVESVGVLAENTTARWAVEGWIGGELLGGIVHEMHVPGFIPDLELPPIGAETAVAVPGSDRTPPAGDRGGQWRTLGVIAAGILLLAAVFFLVLRRRKKA